jgi:hypothetical protein
MGVELLRTYRQTAWQTDMTKLRVAFRNFANAPKNSVLGDYLWLVRTSVQWLFPCTAINGCFLYPSPVMSTVWFKLI